MQPQKKKRKMLSIRLGNNLANPSCHNSGTGDESILYMIYSLEENYGFPNGSDL